MRGFTLIELIMTIVLVGIVSIPLSLLIAQHVTSTAYSKDTTSAFNLARWDMEQVNNTAYTSIVSASFSGYQGYSYDLTRTVAFVAGSGVSAESLKRITVTVTRSGGGS
ncbi:MAG: type II secretion system protein, partial [bacterium]